MTYLEFYQAWSELVMQNVKVITIGGESCSRSLVYTLVAIEFILIIWQVCVWIKKDEDTIAVTVAIFIYIFFIMLPTIAIFSPSEECKKNNYLPIPKKIIYEYPDKDYSVQEFQENMINLSENTSIQQKELARLVMHNCIEKSKNVRECIFNSKPTFEKAELEHIKFQ